jgi:hypothetical protein
MARMERGWPIVRAVALLAAGSVMVHELRYVAAYGRHADQVLMEQGHSYTPLLGSLAIILLAIALARFCGSLLKAGGGVVAEGRPPSFVRLWLGASASLAAAYALQEGFEGEFAPGHPAGLIGMFGHGGWTALVFALLLGAVIALLTGIAYYAIELIARRAPRSREHRSTSALKSVFRTAARRRDVLALNLAGRAPPTA